MPKIEVIALRCLRTLGIACWMLVLFMTPSISAQQTELNPAPVLSPAGLPRHRPVACSGFIASYRSFSVKDETSPAEVGEPAKSGWHLVDGVCPQGFALFSVGAVLRSADSPEKVPIHGQCCRLPADDILLDEHRVESGKCPEDFVATGGTSRVDCSDCKNFLHCTRINSKRYQLGPAEAGVFWGMRGHFWGHGKRIFRSEIPPAIRYGASRWGQTAWQDSGCIGHPFGSLLVEKRSSWCQEFSFRQLRYRGLPGDPGAGSPVKMFPDCTSLSDEFALQAECKESLE